MSRDDPILRVRIPEELRQKLKALAAKQRRSMNQEIVDRLEQSLRMSDADDIQPGRDQSLARLAAIEDRLNALEARQESLAVTGEPAPQGKPHYLLMARQTHEPPDSTS